MAGASVVIGHQDVNVRLSQESTHVNGKIYGTSSTSCCGLESVHGQVDMYSFGMI